MYRRMKDAPGLLMSSPRRQCTVAKTAVVEGFGYWSGKDVRVEFRPAPDNTGIVFVRSDLATPVRIAANVLNRVETPRRTCLRRGASQVEMVEHIMAALAGLNIDNCDVHVSAPEMPGCDGSSRPFVDALLLAGSTEQSALRPTLTVREVTRLGEGESWIEARPSPSHGLSIKFNLDYGPGTPIGRQSITLPITPDSFRRELAPSRTFMLKNEADWLLAQGLGKRTTTKDLLIYGPDGPIDQELRYRDECVRHKALDLIGDLALAGCDIIGHVVAYRSGHRLNAELVRQLLAGGATIDIPRAA